MNWIIALYFDMAAADALFAEAASLRASSWQAAEALVDRGEAIFERLEQELDE